MIRRSVFLTVLLVSGLVIAEDEYVVRSTVFVDGEVLASPVVMIPANEEVRISFGESFNLSYVVQPKKSDAIILFSDLDIGSMTQKSSMFIHLGEEVSILLGNTRLELVVEKSKKKTVTE